MPKKEFKHIISLGNNQANWVANLYAAIKEKDTSFLFDADNYYDLQVADNKNTPFENSYHFRKDYTLKKYFWKYAWYFLSKHFLTHYRFVKAVGSKKQLMDFISIYLNGFITQKEFLSKKHYDIYHFHFIKFSYLFNIFFLPKNKKVICTFWGSDLLRSKNIIDYFFQQKALDRADIITLQNEEMRELVLAKFGRHLKPKIKEALFLMNEDMLEIVDKLQLNQQEINDYKKLHLSCENNEKIVMIGHNANPFNNHVKIIHQLTTLPEHYKKEVIFVFLMTYGNNEKINYASLIGSLCENAGLNHLLITDFLTPKNLALLKLSTDIFIHLPETDAMSGTLIEAAYAGNKVITGSWLPYKKFKQCGMIYQEINNFNHLPAELMQALENPISDSVVEQNRTSIQHTFFKEIVIQNWLNIYNNLIHE